MANENKNTNKLVALSDDDPTSEFEIPASLRNSDIPSMPEIEVDENTFDIFDRDSECIGQTKAELKSALKLRAARIDELEFELEQLRSRHRGMEEELKSRTEITSTINAEVLESHRQIMDIQQQLELRNEECLKLENALENARKDANDIEAIAATAKARSVEQQQQLESQAEKLRNRDETIANLEKELQSRRDSDDRSAAIDAAYKEKMTGLETQLRTTREELADLRHYVDGRKDEWLRLEATVAELESDIKTKSNLIDAQSREIDERNAQLIRSREQIIDASEKLAQQKSRSRKLSTDNRALKTALHNDARREIESCRHQISVQAGEISTASQLLGKLRDDNDRLEKYADSLRMQLQDQISIAKVSVAMRHKLEVGLDVANERINELSRLLDAEQQQNKELESSIEKMHSQFEREVRQIRFELGAAQDTIADQETINEQLASDLIDYKGFRQALESQLDESARKNEATVNKLSRELKKAHQHASEIERKLAGKNKVIADLMAELAGHSSDIEFRDESENILHKVDGFRPDNGRSNSHAERDRLVRLLIGNADGRELRFPLFKDRLSIGRTSHNDIQLNMQYVSRRHAVIATDSGKTRVIDWGSKNGVYVNEERVTEKILASGDIVTIGTTNFVYEEKPKR